MNCISSDIASNLMGKLLQIHIYCKSLQVYQKLQKWLKQVTPILRKAFVHIAYS